MLKQVAFAGCLLAGTTCVFADGPGNKGDLGTDTVVLWDNGAVNYAGIKVPDGDPVDPAMLIFDNGGDDYTNGFEFTFWRMAEDFVLRGPATVEHVDFSLLDTTAGSNHGAWEGTVDWAIYADAGGSPGAMMASGAGMNITAVFDQLTNNWDFWDMSMDLDVPQCLDAGTYWLGLHLNRLCDFRHNLYWGVTGDNGTPNHFQDANCTGNYAASSRELSFSLSGTDGCGDCIEMSVTRLVSGQSATWSVSGVTPNAEVAIVWGTTAGSTSINGFAGYCADFGIKGVNASKVICRKTADGAGNVACKKTLPGGIGGMRVLSQAAERNTCPDTCMSGVDDQVVQ